MTAIAIITARGGSKRIPGKNIRPFLGKPIIAYSIEAALQSGLFAEVMVSTDDEGIATVARKYGAEVPFLRSAKAADDHATTSEALLDVLESYAARGRRFAQACCLYPTAPFVNAAKLVAAHQKLIGEGLDAVFPVMPFSYPVYRALQQQEGRLQLIWNQYRDSRSQDLPQAYHDAGQFYFFDVPAFMRNKIVLTNNIGGIVISEMEGQDIDVETDWTLAELKYQLVREVGHE